MTAAHTPKPLVFETVSNEVSAVERAEWLKKMRLQAEALYDQLAPAYWVKFGLYANTAHRQFIEEFLGRLEAHSTILDAACGAGRYDGRLLEAGHAVLGIDQSGSMLARAREFFPQERFPGLRFAKIGLQEMDFQAKFGGVICIDALEHVCPEDWPGILARFQKALKSSGVLYVTVEVAEWGEVSEAYERAKALGLPVVLGEVVNEIGAAYLQAVALDGGTISGEQADLAVYHYYPPLKQVRLWLDQAGLAIEEEGTGDGYAHLLARKNA
jgi:2-polyprenyl-3-methyl-5-hydroxy-6-metoxy-1,4-benzoquinol methylase